MPPIVASRLRAASLLSRLSDVDILTLLETDCDAIQVRRWMIGEPQPAYAIDRSKLADRWPAIMVTLTKGDRTARVLVMATQDEPMGVRAVMTSLTRNIPSASEAGAEPHPETESQSP